MATTKLPRQMLTGNLFTSLSSSATTVLDFSGGWTIGVLDGLAINTTVSTTSLAAGSSYALRIKDNGVSRTLTFPGTWTWLTTPPAATTVSKWVLITLECLNADTPVILADWKLADTAATLAEYQPLDSDLTAIAALSTTSFGRSVLTAANAAAGATLFGVGTGDSPTMAALTLTGNFKFNSTRSSGLGCQMFDLATGSKFFRCDSNTFQILNNAFTNVIYSVSDSGDTTAYGYLRSNSPTAGIGYSAGAGGAVTQTTNRTTGVTINKVSGQITLVSAAGSTTPNTFTVTNSTVADTDTVLVSQKSGTDKYVLLVTTVGSGSFAITAYTTGGTTVEQPVINFTVQKGVNA